MIEVGRETERGMTTTKKEIRKSVTLERREKGENEKE